MIDESTIREITLRVLQDTQVPIGVSGRHVHLCRADFDALFGVGAELTFKKELMGGQFAAGESVALVGKNHRVIQNVRVLGPLREFTQVEISATDGFTLGISAPLRDSGDLKGSAAVTLIGPKGVIYLGEGMIVARRHIHLSPADARVRNVHDKEIVRVRVSGPRGGILDNVLIRVDPSFTTEMHIDTDEANGLGISTGADAVICKMPTGGLEG